MNLRDLMFNVSFNGDEDPVMKMDSAVDDLKDSVVGATGGLEDMADVLDSSSNVDNIDDMEDAIDDLDNSVEKATGNLGKMSKGFDKTGKSLMKKLTAPIVAMGTASIHAVTGFDDSMSKVQALSGATTSEFGEMRDMAKDLGATTAHSASAAADGMGILASAGYNTNQILATTPQVLSLASAGGLDLANTASILTGTIAQFNLEAEDSLMVSDAMAKAQAISKASVEGLGEAMAMAGGDAANMGMDVQQTSAMLGLFANANIGGSRAGTTFGAMFKDLTSKVENGTVQIGKTSVAVYDAAGNIRDMGSVMTDVEKATMGMTDAQRDAALQNIFAGQSMRGVNAFLSQGADKYKELESAIYDSEGAAADMAEEMENNIGGAFRSMGSAIEGFMIDMGDVFKEDIRAVADWIGDLAGKFGKLPDGAQKAIVTVAGLAAAMGPLIWGGGKVMGIMSDMPDMIGGTSKAFGMLTSPIGLTVAAIVGVIAILINLYNTNEEFRDRVNDIWKNIKTIVGGAVEWIGDKWAEHGEGIMATVGEVFGVIQSVVEVAIGVVLDVLGGLFRFLGGLLDFIVGVFTGDWAKAWDGLGNMVGGAIDVIKGFWDGLINLFKKPVTGIVNIFRRDKGDKGDTDVGIDGSHYSGLGRVPFDGYVGLLHENEEILTADDPRNQNNPNPPKPPEPKPPKPSPRAGTGGMEVNYNPQIEITVGSGTSEKDKSDLLREFKDISRETFMEFLAELNMQLA